MKVYRIRKLTPREAGRLMDASHAFDELIKALKMKPKYIMDAPQNIKITWEYNKE